MKPNAQGTASAAERKRAAYENLVRVVPAQTLVSAMEAASARREFTRREIERKAGHDVVGEVSELTTQVNAIVAMQPDSSPAPPDARKQPRAEIQRRQARVRRAKEIAVRALLLARRATHDDLTPKQRASLYRQIDRMFLVARFDSMGPKRAAAISLLEAIEAAADWPMKDAAVVEAVTRARERVSLSEDQREHVIGVLDVIASSFEKVAPPCNETDAILECVCSNPSKELSEEERDALDCNKLSEVQRLALDCVALWNQRHRPKQRGETKWSKWNLLAAALNIPVVSRAVWSEWRSDVGARGDVVVRKKKRSNLE